MGVETFLAGGAIGGGFGLLKNSAVGGIGIALFVTILVLASLAGTNKICGANFGFAQAAAYSTVVSMVGLAGMSAYLMIDNLADNAEKIVFDKPIVVGIVAGGLAVIMGLILLAVTCCKKKTTSLFT